MRIANDYIEAINASPDPWLHCVAVVNKPTAADHGLITPIPLGQAVETNYKRLKAGEDAPLGIVFVGTKAEAEAECNRLVEEPEPEGGSI